MTTFFESSGTLRYSINPYKLIVEVDKDLAKYYRSMIPKYFKTNTQAYSPHISVVRNETPAKLEFWHKYEGEIIVFTYSNIIYQNDTYYWINVYSRQLEDIREELGLLRKSDFPSPHRPLEFDWTFHITVGNAKDI